VVVPTLRDKPGPSDITYIMKPPKVPTRVSSDFSRVITSRCHYYHYGFFNLPIASWEKTSYM